MNSLNTSRLACAAFFVLFGGAAREASAQTYDLASFEKAAAEQAKTLAPSKRARVAPALESAGCRVLASGDRSGAIARTSTRTTRVSSMGEIAFATCGAGTTYTLESTVKAVSHSNKGGAQTISSEVALPGEPDAAGFHFGRLPPAAGRERAFVVTWRSPHGQQFVLTQYDSFDEAIVRPTLLAIATSAAAYLK